VARSLQSVAAALAAGCRGKLASPWCPR